MPNKGNIEKAISMSDGSNSNSNGTTAGDTAAAAGSTEKAVRETRKNHASAESFPITDAASAQAFCDASIEATKNEKQAAMFNGSGFVTPSILDRQDVANRTRLGASVINSLAASVEQDGEVGQQAQEALQVLASYASTASAAREEARNARILAQADAIRSKQGGKQRATAR